MSWTMVREIQQVVEGGQGGRFRTVRYRSSFFKYLHYKLATAANVQNSNNVKLSPNNPLNGKLHTYRGSWDRERHKLVYARARCC